MMWYDGDMGGWGLALMIVGNVLFWAVIIIGVVALVRYFGRSTHQTSTQRRETTPEQLLAERFARGEVDEEEYRRRRQTLREHPADTS